MARHRIYAAVLSAVASFGCYVPANAADVVKLEKGDHVCIVGNTLADRMHQFGWVETLIHSRLPEHNLVFRNLGYSGDEITTRLRSKNFGSPDEWLSGKASPIGGFAENRLEKAETKADVIFAFFGYNESFGGQPGLEKFKKDLDKWVKDTLGQKYNGKSAPRIVLFSPIAHENLKNPNLPDGSASNANLKLYTEAMGEVAKAHNVGFVDLFAPTLAAYGKGDKPWTINGIHLNEDGNKGLAKIVDQALFGAGAKDDAALGKLYAAVQDKNWHWFHRYRTTDGFSTYGDRAFLKFTDGQTNYVVLQRELQILDVMTSNRDKAVWAAAQGKEQKVDDSNTPPFIPVKTNKPGKGPDGTHIFLTGEEAIGKMKIGPNLKVTLFASEKEYPELVAPVQVAWDTKGRLWVAVWPSYPHWTPKNPMADKLLILEDTNNDGKADKCTTFAGDLHNPTGFEFGNGGVYVAQGPDILFLKDTNGDDKYDVRETVLHGLDTADTHHAANSFTFDPGGALYFQEGTFHHTQVETPWGPAERTANGAVFRFEPKTFKFEAYTSYGFANPHGHVFDKWGNDIVIDGTGAVPYIGSAFSGKTYFPAKHGKAPVVYKQRTRPCSGAEMLSSAHFPEDMQGNLLVLNVIGFQGILQYKIAEKGSAITGTEVEPILSSEDPNFRPSDIEIGPDGAIYFADWQNPIIGHMQHNLRDPSRDHVHGRVYKVTYEGREPQKPVKIAGESVDNLVALLKHPQNRVRYQAKIELSGRKAEEVIAAVKKWADSLDKSDKDYEHQMMEVLWVHQWHNVVDQVLLKRMLTSPEPKARAAATRVLCYWRDRVSDPLSLLKVQANDKDPNVRREAVRACSFFKDPKAADVALESLNHPQDDVLKYVLDETVKTLEKLGKQK